MWLRTRKLSRSNRTSQCPSGWPSPAHFGKLCRLPDNQLHSENLGEEAEGEVLPWVGAEGLIRIWGRAMKLMIGFLVDIVAVNSTKRLLSDTSLTAKRNKKISA